MPLYSARPPLTPPRILSVRLRRSWGRAGGAGRRRRGLPHRRVEGGGGGRRGRRGGRCGCHARSLPTAGRRNPSGNAPIRPWFLDVFRGDHRCRAGVARCDDRYRDHHCDRGAAPSRPPRGRRSCARGRGGCWPASRPGRRRTCARTRSSSGSPSPSSPPPGIGIVAYGLLWLTMPVAAPGEDPEPGRSSWAPGTGRRQLDRPRRPRARRRRRCSASSRSGAAATSSCRWSWSPPAWRVIWRQLDTDRTLAVPGVRWALAGGVVAGGRRRGPAAGHDRPARRRPQRLRRHAGDPHRRRAGDRADLAPAARLARRGAHRAHPLGGAGRRRRAPARLGAADPGAHPAARRRAAGGQPAGPQPGARAARLALRPEGRPRGRHLGRAGRRHGRRGRGRPRADRRPGRRRRRPGRRRRSPRSARPPARRWSTRPSTPGATAADLYTEVTPGAGVGLRPRPRQGVRSGDGARRPARAARLGQRPADPAGRDGGDPLGAGRRDRGGARAAEESRA